MSQFTELTSIHDLGQLKTLAREIDSAHHGLGAEGATGELVCDLLNLIPYEDTEKAANILLNYKEELDELENEDHSDKSEDEDY